MAPPDPPAQGAVGGHPPDPPIQQPLPQSPKDIHMKEFSLGGDPDDTGARWSKWRKELETRLRYFRIVAVQDKCDALNIYGGEVVRELAETLPARPVPEGQNLDEFTATMAKLDHHFQPMANADSARAKLDKMSQLPTETLAQFHVRVRQQADKCNFPDKEDAIRSKILLAMKDGALRREAMVKSYSLTELLKHASNKEDIERQAAEIESADQQVHKVVAQKSKGQFQPKNFKNFKKTPHYNHKPSPAKDTPSNNTPAAECEFCGYVHGSSRSTCPASGQECRKCHRKGHFAKKCRAFRGRGAPRAHAVVTSDPQDEGVEYLLRVKGDPADEKDIVVEMKVEGKTVNFQVDCGASVNVIPQHYVPDTVLQSCSTKLIVWNKQEVQPAGKCRLIIQNCKDMKRYNAEFVVVREHLMPLLSKRTSEQMGLITVHYDKLSAVKDIVTEVFSDEIGTLPGSVHLTIDPEATPHAIASCRVPFSLRDKVKVKLQEMESKGVIERVDKPTDWVSRMVASQKKDGDVRICIDPQVLNQALKREVHTLPVLDDILPDLAKAKVFSKYDLRNGYWHCVLDNESSDLTCMITPHGRYKWKRLPFGLAVSSEIFQKRLLEALEGLPGVTCIADDILVYGCGDSQEEADKDLERNSDLLMMRCHDKGIHLNAGKTEVKQTRMHFQGHILTNEGIIPDDAKVEAITLMEAPTNVVEVQRLNGLINYLARYLPGLSEVMEPIRRLTNKGVDWQWGEPQAAAFVKVKELVTSAPVLRYYRPEEELTIQCDASQHGLGAAILQRGQPVAYASRALTPAETRYAQLEKEMLAVVFALNKFHQYTFGRHTTVLSDHKPLSSIIKKPLDSAPRRLQGMLMRALQYDIEIVYLKGTEMHIADLLSRSHLSTTEGGEDFERINMVQFLPVRQERLEKIRIAVKSDPIMIKLSDVIQAGWPEEKKDLPVELVPYFHSREEYVVQDGLIFKGERVVIPSILRPEIRKALHSSHLGIESCLRRARECVYWPGMNSDLKEYIQQCEICNSQPKAQQDEPLMSHETPDRPWEKVGVDLMDVKGTAYLVTVDYFSNFWEVDRLNTTTAAVVIKKLKSHFARYGSPAVLISDNGPQFSCEEFHKFACEWDFEHRTSSPGHAQSNGMAESAVKSAKQMIIKCQQSHQDINMAILDHRNTPSQDMGSSPAQRMLGRRTRTLLPTTAKLLKPEGVNTDVTKKLKRLKCSRSEWYHDKHAKTLEPLEEGDCVRMKPMVLGKKTWDKGVITKRLDERSYEVETDSGTLRRNRVYLRKTSEPEPDVHDVAVETPQDSMDIQNAIPSHVAVNETPRPATTPTATPAKAVPMDRPARPVRSTRNVLPGRFQDFEVKK